MYQNKNFDKINKLLINCVQFFPDIYGNVQMFTTKTYIGIRIFFKPTHDKSVYQSYCVSLMSANILQR